MTALDSSEIDAISLNVAGTGAVAVGVSLSGNVIANTVEAEITDSDVTAGGLNMTAEADEIIRSLAVGVSGSGAVAVQVTAIGNVIADQVLAQVTGGSNVTTTGTGSITIQAMDQAPTLVPDWTTQGLPFHSSTYNTSDTGSTTVNSGDTVDVLQGFTGSGTVGDRYQYKGSTASLDLTSANYNDTSKWTDLGNSASLDTGTLSGSFSGSTVQPTGNILAIVASIAGTGGVAVNGVLAGNIITDTVRADIIGSTVTAGGSVSLTATSNDAIMAATAGVAGSGAVAVNATGFGNVITETVAATISGNSTVTSTSGSTGLTARNESHITSLAISVAGSTVAIGGLIGANVITNTVEAEISGSSVAADTSLTLDAESTASILGLTLSLAGGVGAVGITLSANVISDTTEALIVDSGTAGAPVSAGGAITLTANDGSQINALSFDVAVGGGAAGLAVAVNTIVNTIEANVEDSTVQGASLSQTAESQAIIRTLVIGVSGGGASFGLTAVGNVIHNTVEAEITGDSTVTTSGAINLTAEDIAPSTIPSWTVPTNDQSTYNSGTSSYPGSLSSANIVALVINVGGAGGVAASVTVLGNVIDNTVATGIISSTVKAGVSPLNGAADINLTSETDDSIIAAMAGFVLSGVASLGANVMGNAIANGVTATVQDSTVRAGGQLAISAKDESSITGADLGFAASFSLFSFAGNVVMEYNDIGNTIEAEISGSDVETGSGVSASAVSNAQVLSFVAGAAISGGAAGNLSATINDIHNTVEAAIENDGARACSVNAGVLSSSTSASVTVSASDTSTIDAIAIGLSAGGLLGAGAATADNYIGSLSGQPNTVEATIANSTVISGGATDVTATSTEIIRSVAAGISGAGGVAGQASITDNEIDSTVEASVTSATITAGGEVLIKASDTAPGGGLDYLSAMDIPASTLTKVENALNSNSNASYSQAANIVSLAGSIGGAGLAAGSVAVSTNSITNTISATVTSSAVTSTGSDVTVEAISGEQIASIAAGIGAAGGVALNASAATNTIDNNVSAYIDGASTIEAGASSPINVTATDTGSINSLAISLAGALGFAAGGAVVTNTIDGNTLAYVSGTSDTSRTEIDGAGLVTIEAQATESATGIALGATLGTVAAGASVVTATIGGTTEAYLGNYTDVGNAAGMTVGGLTVEAIASDTTLSEVWGLSGGIGALTYNEAASTATPVLLAYVGSDPSYTGSNPNDTNVNVTGAMTVSAGATPQLESDASGIALGALAAGASVATATVSPTVTAKAAGNIEAGSLIVQASDSEASGQHAAEASTTGSTGGLVAVDGTQSTAVNTGTVTSYVDNGTTLTIGSSVAITATNNTDQYAVANGDAYGLVAAGGNVAEADSNNVSTQAYIGTGVTITGGTSVVGLTDGGQYYVVPIYESKTIDPATDISGNEVDLGAGSGFMTGDQVVYQTGSYQSGTDSNGIPVYTPYAPIGGLTDNAVYTLTADASRPGYFTLKDQNGNLVTTLTPGSATGNNQSFQEISPTRVMLASSFDNATSQIPVTLSLSEPTVPAPGHTLTPANGDAAITFDPGTELNTADGSIYVGPDSGLYQGEAVVYAKATAPSVTISATGYDTNLAQATSGSGGLLAGAGAASTVRDTSTTEAYIADASSSSNATNLDVAALTVTANHTARFDAEANSLAAGLVGGSGASGYNDANSTVQASIGNYTNITTQSLDVTAQSTTLKNFVAVGSGDWDVQAGSGGVFAGSAADSETDITNNTSATIGNYVSIAVTGSITNPGDFIVSAYNDVEAYDSVDIDAGGAIAGAGVVSEIRADTNNATAALGNNDVISTVGDLDLESYTKGILDSEPKAHTYGLAAAASVDALARIHENDAVNVGTGTLVTAMGNLNLLAGENHLGTENYFSVTSHGDELNAAAIPIDSLTSHGEVVQNNTVYVGGQDPVTDIDTDLRAAKDANLTAQTLGDILLEAYGTGKDWLTAVSGAINSALGGTPIPATMQGGTGTETTVGTVTVNGNIEVGIEDTQTLIIDMDGTVDHASTGDITFTTDTESEANNLVMEFNYYTELAQVYGGSTAGQAYATQAGYIATEMQQLGLTATGSAGTAYITSYVVPFITVSPIWAQQGSINILASNPSGNALVVNGTLDAAGNVAVTIDNKSPAYLRIEGITIPNNTGAGQVMYNYNPLTSLNGGTLGVTGSGHINAAGGSGSTEPTITIKSEFNASDPVDQSYAPSAQTPDIEIAGDINNLNGTVTITSAGGVTEEANLDAGTVTITAGGGYVQNYTNALSNVGGDPAAQYWWQQAINQAVADASLSPTNTSYTYAAGADSTIQADIAKALAAQPTSSIVSGGNVFIAAEYLNIDGIVQSGQPAQTVTIGTNAATQISEANTVYSYEQAGQTWYAQYLESYYGLSTSDGKLFKLTTDGANDTISAAYDAQTQQIELGSISVQGGYMQLYGDIVSTGSGQIKVLDGYGTVSITNNTTYAIVTNNISTGTGVAGELLITNTAYTNGSGTPLTTVYTVGTNDQVAVSNYYGDPSHPASTSDPNYQAVVGNADLGQRTAIYTPLSGQRYYWTEGQQFMETTTNTYSASSWLGITAFYTPSNLTSSNTVATGGLAIQPGAYVAGSSVTTSVSNWYGGSSNQTTTYSGNFSFSGQFNAVGTATTQDYPVQESSTWYGKKTYTSTSVTEQGYDAVYMASIKADQPINIQFIGSDTGGITVTSQGSVVIKGSIQDAVGTTSITSSGGDIETGAATASVGGYNIILSAASSIGAGNALTVDPTTPNNGTPGVINATSTTGDIDLTDPHGDMVVSQIESGTSSAPAGDITLSAAGSIKAATAAQIAAAGLSATQSLIVGGAVTLTATDGGIGSFGTGGTYANPATDALPINMDTGTDATHDTLTATAQGDVYIVELTGDLRVNAITTPADVRVEVLNGNLTNANTTVTTDSRTWNELLSMYDDMDATGASAQTSVNNTIAAYQQAETQDYQTYWSYRNSQSDDYVGGLTQGQTYYVEAEREHDKSFPNPGRRACEYNGLGRPRGGRRPTAPLHRFVELRHLQ